MRSTPRDPMSRRRVGMRLRWLRRLPRALATGLATLRPAGAVAPGDDDRTVTHPVPLGIRTHERSVA